MNKKNKLCHRGPDKVAIKTTNAPWYLRLKCINPHAQGERVLGVLTSPKVPLLVGRFRILLGGQGLEYWGTKERGQNSQQAHDVVTTSMRRNDVASTSFRRHVPTRFLINQCQIITFFILKSDIIENSRIELSGIVLPVYLQIKLKLHFLLTYPSTWYICVIFSWFT